MRSRGMVAALAAVAVYLLIVLFWVAHDRRSRLDAGGPGSSFNSAGDGCSLAFRYLAASGKASRLSREISSAELPASGVIFRIAPHVKNIFELLREESDDDSGETSAPPLLDADEEEWVRGGGRMVIAAGGKELPAGTTHEARKVFPLFGAVRALIAPLPRVIDPLPAKASALWTLNDQPVVMRRVIGRGDVIVTSLPELFTNSELRRGDHLKFLVALAAGRPVLFDEVVHGIRDDAGLLELMKQWGLGPFVALAAIVFALRLWRNGRRIGDADIGAQDDRSEAVDLVDSVGRLYQRSLTSSEMLALYAGSLHRAAARAGLRDPSPAPEVKRDDEKSETLTKVEFLKQLHTINEGFRRLDRAKHG